MDLVLDSCYGSRDIVVSWILRWPRQSDTHTARDRPNHSSLPALERKEHFDRKVAHG